MKKQLKKILFVFFLAFIALFVFRLVYGYLRFQNGSTGIDSVAVQSSSFSQKNYASKKYKVKQEKATQSIQADQKYEKIATINTKSTKFSKEEEQARQAVKQYNALIQFEQKSGNKGNRRLTLLIGVPPEHFDTIYQDLIKIGNVRSKQITKTDKTNEYKALNAHKKSLEKMLSSLNELKSKDGKIQEFMELETRALEIEKQLQELGVSLGDFDAENEFCTVNFSLNERKAVNISLMHRIKVALEWTIPWYLGLMAIAFLVLLAGLILIVILDKLKVIQRLISEK